MGCCRWLIWKLFWWSDSVISENISGSESLNWHTACTNQESPTSLAFKDAQILTPTYFPALAHTFHQDTPDHWTLTVLKPTQTIPISSALTSASPDPIYPSRFSPNGTSFRKPSRIPCPPPTPKEKNLFLLQDPLEHSSSWLDYSTSGKMPSSSLLSPKYAQHKTSTQ